MIGTFMRYEYDKVLGTIQLSKPQPQPNLNTTGWFDTKMTVQTTPPNHRNSTVAFKSLRLTFIDHN